MNYNKIYNDIIQKRKFNIPSGYTEKHHIIPRSLGGNDDKNNLVKLTAKEHFICHLLLTKMYEKGSNEYYKMCHALLMMLMGSKNHQRYSAARRYEKLRIESSQHMSVIMKIKQGGENNSGYGTIWIHNKEIKQSKKIPKNYNIEDGWEIGRVIFWDKIKKPKKCNKCGEVLCNTTDICSKGQMTNTFIKYFGFDSSTKGTKNFPLEFNRIVNLLKYEYHVNKLSVEDIKIKYNLTSNERTRMMLKSLGIERRDLKEAYKNTGQKCNDYA